MLLFMAFDTDLPNVTARYLVLTSFSQRTFAQAIDTMIQNQQPY